jgi:DNA-binding response OmpR family regulator
VKIMLVEDHETLAQISTSLLTEVHEHEVLHVSNGGDALKDFSRFNPDVVLLDLNLPDMSGYDVATRLREQPSGQAVVIVALSGFGAVTDIAREDRAGIDVHFRKPMDFAVLPTLRRKPAH